MSQKIVLSSVTVLKREIVGISDIHVTENSDYIEHRYFIYLRNHRLEFWIRHSREASVQERDNQVQRFKKFMSNFDYNFDKVHTVLDES